jgi:hypothetical protein
MDQPTRSRSCEKRMQLSAVWRNYLPSPLLLSLGVALVAVERRLDFVLRIVLRDLAGFELGITAVADADRWERRLGEAYVVDRR